jgi:hypothetical protein
MGIDQEVVKARFIRSAPIVRVSSRSICFKAAVRCLAATSKIVVWDVDL